MGNLRTRLQADRAGGHDHQLHSGRSDRKPILSSGVERELQHAHETTKEVYVVWRSDSEPSPFRDRDSHSRLQNDDRGRGALPTHRLHSRHAHPVAGTPGLKRAWMYSVRFRIAHQARLLWLCTSSVALLAYSLHRDRTILSSPNGLRRCCVRCFRASTESFQALAKTKDGRNDGT